MRRMHRGRGSKEISGTSIQAREKAELNVRLYHQTLAHLLDGWVRFRARCFTKLISGQFKEIGVGTRISPPLRFDNLGQVSLGDGVIINRDCWILTLNEKNHESSPKLIIKSHAGIGMGATISAASRILIEEYVLLARNVYISDHGHAYE